MISLSPVMTPSVRVPISGGSVGLRRRQAGRWQPACASSPNG